MSHTLLQDEKLLESSYSNRVHLTSKRIIWSTSRNYEFIPLEHVSHLIYGFHHKLLFLILAILSFFIGAVLSNNSRGALGETGILILFVGVILIVLYLISIKKTIDIYSTSGQSISWRARGMSAEEIMAFLDRVQYAKDQMKK